MAVDWAKADIVLAHLEAGESLRSAAEKAGSSAPSFLRWAGEDKALAERYARAREVGYKLLADELIAIADEGSGDWQRDRLRVDTRKWMLAKMLPKVYGERTEHNVSGGITVNLSRVENEL